MFCIDWLLYFKSILYPFWKPSLFQNISKHVLKVNSICHRIWFRFESDIIHHHSINSLPRSRIWQHADVGLALSVELTQHSLELELFLFTDLGHHCFENLWLTQHSLVLAEGPGEKICPMYHKLMFLCFRQGPEMSTLSMAYAFAFFMSLRHICPERACSAIGAKNGTYLTKTFGSG